MCLALYLFTDGVLPESEWNEENPQVFVLAVQAGEDRKALEWPHREKNVYYVGGYQGCGCGWAPISEWDHPADLEAKPKDRLELGRLIRSVDLANSWLVSCWEGAQGEHLQPDVAITIEQIEDPLFEFAELQPYRIT